VDGRTCLGVERPTLAALDELTDLVAVRPGLHIRYSKGPQHDGDERSRDYESGLELPGLSANPLDPPRWWTRAAADWLARQICAYVHLDDGSPQKIAWVLTGRLVGRGPDNEPLLASVDPVAYLADSLIDEARLRYEQCFDVGRDSRG